MTQTSQQTSARQQALAQMLQASGAKSITDRALAAYADKQDPLKSFRQLYNFPTRKRVRPIHLREKQGQDDDDDGQLPAAYFAGNSLGLMPKQTPDLIKQELDVWAQA